MKQLAYLLKDFNFECIGTAQTDDEMVICESLEHFGDIISMIEDEREKMVSLNFKWDKIKFPVVMKITKMD